MRRPFSGARASPPHRQSRGVIGARSFPDPVWWLPIYLAQTLHFYIKPIGIFAWVPYARAMLGSLGGGWLSGRLIRRG